MKTAVVTGAAKRIGKVIAEHLLALNYQVVLHAYTSADELKNWVDKSEHRERVLVLVTADLATAEGQEHLVASIKEHVDALDLLVNNASVFFPEPFSGITRASFRDMWAINLEAPFFITQGVLHVLRRANAPSVINLIDAMWERPSPLFSHYAASKGGLSILTRALACELAPEIRVNAVAPGSILFTSFHDQAAKNKIIDSIPLNRLGTPSDIAEAIIFLAEKAPYISGEILVVDGARSVAS